MYIKSTKKSTSVGLVKGRLQSLCKYKATLLLSDSLAGADIKAYFKNASSGGYHNI